MGVTRWERRDKGRDGMVVMAQVVRGKWGGLKFVNHSISGKMPLKLNFKFYLIYFTEKRNETFLN